MKTRTDSQIHQAVLNELKWDHRVDETDVGVEVDAGVVTLTGTVGSWAKRIAAQDAAHRVAGVLDVANDVQVKIPGDSRRTDTELAAAVRGALEWDVFVNDLRIRSTVTDGWVTLEGDVERWSDRDDVERAIRNLVGVRGVTNKIQIDSPRVTATAVRKSIEEALERRADRDARRIALDVHGDSVTMSGVVHSWGEKEAVVGAARGTPGVRRIEDRLRIEPVAL